MLVGHLAVAFAAKRAQPRVSLGTLALASLAPDVLWCCFQLAGIEHVRYQPGMGAAHYLAALDVPWSHSLLMNAAWAVLSAGGYYWLRRRGRAAWLLFAVVLSHWLLDWVAHPPDMPLAPGLDGRFGLGLWRSVPATILVEGGCWLAAPIVYARAFRAKKLAGAIAFWLVAALPTLAWYNNIAGPPPPHPEAAPVASSIFFSPIVTWAYWFDRLRSPVTAR